MHDQRPASAIVRIGERHARISALVFGGLAEHFGTTVNDGMWSRATGQARADVKAAVKAMGVRLIRYPGGTYATAYHWRDGVGPHKDRPYHERTLWTELGELWGNGILSDGQGTSRTPELTPTLLGKLMGPPEPNLVGTDEFLRYCVDIDAEPYILANFGTGSPEEAADWVRYTNRPESPTRVHWWGLGNESYFLHEPGHASPNEYGKRLAEFAEEMKAADPTIAVVGVGLPVFPPHVPITTESPIQRYGAAEWNRGVLEAAADAIDALNLHWYFPGPIGRPLSGIADYQQLVTAPDLFDEALGHTVALLDDAAPARGLCLAVDEWNRMVELEDHFSTNHTLADAGFFAGVYTALLAHADRVQLACISHLVNCLAPIQATPDGRMFMTAAYLIAQLYAEYATGWTRRVDVDDDPVQVPELQDVRMPAIVQMTAGARRGRGLVAAATTGSMHDAVFLTSRHLDRPTSVSVSGLPGYATRAELRLLTGPDLFASNTMEYPDALHWSKARVTVVDGEARVTLPPGGTGVLLVPCATISATGPDQADAA